MPTVATVLEQISLDEFKTSQVESLLIQYAKSDADKDNQRVSFLKESFSLIFQENALIKGSDEYNAQYQVPWSTNCWLQPSVIVTPTSSQQVATILALCRFFHTKFSIRGGGHLHNPGFNSNNDGVVISLSKFDQVRLSDDKSTADVGVGLRWLDVYKALDCHGLAVAGGRMPTVGVPGLLLGGGLSFQNSEYGMGATTISNYEVVLANSEIVNANAHQNTDLFWALKGGGTNYGIVTRIEMMTVPNQIWSEIKIYPPTAHDTLTNALMQYHESIEGDNKASIIWMASNESIVVTYIYCSPTERPSSIFESFDDIPCIMQPMPLAPRTISEFTEILANYMSSAQMNHELRTMTSRPSLEVYQAIDNARIAQSKELSDVEGLAFSTVIQPMSSLAIKQSQREGGTPLGLQPVGQQWLLTTAEWTDARDEDRVREAVRKIVDAAETAAKEAGVYLPYKYSNYSSRDQSPLASYGRENLLKLREIAQKYDPDGVFQTLQNGGWLVSKA